MNKITIDSLLSDVAHFVNKKRYQDALDVYARLYQKYPNFLNPEQGVFLSDDHKIHIQNAANLARRSLYELTFSLGSTPRLKEAIEMFCGAKPKTFANEKQKPNFFYIPELPSAPFLNVNDVDGLPEWVDSLSKHKHSLLALCADAHDDYVDTVGGAPDTLDWNALREKWKSLHLKKAGEWTADGELLCDQLKTLLSSDFVAHCPPHAPEIVISVLQPNTQIPLHFGISNIKWTLHIPLAVNNHAYLNVSDIECYWEADTSSLLFDDSFEHGAANNADVARSVLIIDIWNPALTQRERTEIQKLMQTHSDWASKYGALSSIDSRFYV
ncbi:aspartyl/asparaginyl beta-hydroxylase domain-containing protein [Alteromonas stellipolaris]|uniref:aspartyl/asparaginyl beta-hydroxylase domain-containing protein n=1 Tax=Alteromonas stellipolaris TaxID=233316 RepID=UPI0021181FB4|nr:aspartyl/asparaginyl beta-hydroxylase domain-containing protein [Alteromonas stellipolaris]MCQ8847655.1 aspartyl/asparaginyl beta-hydroxylase domain-containing protein [Alteromonas stellipolaris]